MHRGDHQQARGRGLVGKRKQLASAANPHRPAAQQEERNVAAELLRQAAQFRQFHLAPRQNRQRQQHRRGIRRSAAQPRAHGNAFPNPHLHSPRDAHRLQRHPGRARGEVVGNAEVVFHLDGGLPAGREGHVDGVRQRNGLKDGAQLVEAVGALAEHAQIEIDFGQRAQPGAPPDWPSHRLAGLDAVRLPPKRERSTAFAMA